MLTSMPCLKLPTEGTKIGRAFESGIELDFRHVFVLEAKPVYSSNAGALPVS